MMNVGELIKELSKYDPELPVITDMHSEYVLIDKDSIHQTKKCPPRLDGWVAEARPDKPLNDYLYIGGINF